MKQIKKYGNTVTSLILVLLMSLSLVQGNIAHAQDTSQTNAVDSTKTVIPATTGPDYVQPDTLYAYGGGDSASHDAWLHSVLEDDVHYLFLPPSVDTAVYLWSSYNENITITNIENLSDSFILQNGMNGPFNISTSNTYTVVNDSEVIIPILKFMHSQAEGAMFITTTDENDEFIDNFDFITEDKSNETRARYVASENTGESIDGIIRRFRGRGNTTWQQTKKPFNINLDVREGLYGMGSSRRWALLANYQEGSLMRNRLLYDLSHEVGLQFAPNSRFVEFYVNGTYLGSYQISERVSLGNNDLVKIRNLEDATEARAQQVTGDSNFDVYETYGNETYQRSSEYNGGVIQYYDIPEEYNPADISGGYLLEANSESNAEGDWSRFITPRGQLMVISSPEFVTEAQAKYIFDYYAAIEAAIYDGEGNYNDLIDVDSFAKIYLIQELAKNIDGGIASTFFYKDSNAKLFAGPAWDYDVALGNLHGSRGGVNGNVTYNTDNPIGWFTRYIHKLDNSSERTILGAITQVDSIWDRINQVWNEEFLPAMEIINNEAPAGSRLKSIHEYERLLTNSAEMNFTLHPIPFNGNPGNPWGFTWIPAVANTFGGQVEYLSDWINIRANWLTHFMPAFDRVDYIYDNSVTLWSNVFCYAWNDDGEEAAPWPGIPMLNIEDNTFITVNRFENVIFNDGAGNQTNALVSPVLADGTPLTFKATSPQGSGVWHGLWMISEAHFLEINTIRFINAENWENPTAYFWQSFMEGVIPWPGIEMEYIENNTYELKISSVFNRIIFSGNNGDSQTRNLEIPGNESTYDLSTDTWIRIPRNE